MKQYHKYIVVAGLSVLAVWVFSIIVEKSTLTSSAKIMGGELSSQIEIDHDTQKLITLELNKLRHQMEMLSKASNQNPYAQQIAELQNQLGVLKSNFPDQSAVDMEIQNNTKVVEEKTDIDITTDSVKQQRLEADYYQTIENKLESEEVDPLWSVDAESLVVTAFDGEALQGTAITHMDCRTTLCKLEISYDSERDLNEITQNIRENISSELPSGRVKILADGSAIYYLGRQRESFPEYETNSE